MGICNSASIAHKLKKFEKISKLSQSYASDTPLWSTIIFEPERTLYLGWRFQVEAPPILDVTEQVMVNFEHFNSAMRFSEMDIRIHIGEHSVTIEERDDAENTRFELKRFYIDLTNFLISPPEDLEMNRAYENMLDDILWARVGSTRDRMDYMKYGVMLTKNSMIAMDTESAVAYIDKPTGVDIPVLLHLPWCNILEDLGEIVHIGQWESHGQNAYLRIHTEDDFILTIPVLKVYPNPSIETYVKSFSTHLTLWVDTVTIKQLSITTDNAYKFATVYTKDGGVFIESESNTKGKTTIRVADGDGLEDESVSVSLDFLKKIAGLTGRLDIDLDNLVGFVTNNSRTYGFALG